MEISGIGRVQRTCVVYSRCRDKRYTRGLVSDTILIPLITFALLVSERILGPLHPAQVLLGCKYFCGFSGEEPFVNVSSLGVGFYGDGQCVSV